MIDNETRYNEMITRAKATGLMVGIYLAPRPRNAKDGDTIELPPLRLQGDLDEDLATALDHTEPYLRDWEAHPDHPRVSFRRSDRWIDGFQRGYAFARREAKADDAA